MDTTQFILQETGKFTINNEYTVDIPDGHELHIDWFKNNDLIVNGQTFNSCEDVCIIKLGVPENLNDLPIRFERGDYLVAGNILIDHRNREYLTADKIDIMENEIVATKGSKITRVTFEGSNGTQTQYARL